MSLPAAALAVTAALGLARVLPPETGGEVRRALASAGLEVRELGVSTDRADIVACAGSRCEAFALTDPAAGCSGRPAGPFCLEGAAGEVAAKAARALASVAAPWREAEPPAPPPAAPVSSGAAAVALAVALVFVPWLLGLLLAVLLRRLLSPALRRLSALAIAAGALAAAPLAVRLRPDLGVYDAALVSFLLMLPLVLRSLPAEPRRVALRDRSLLLFVVLALAAGLELWARHRPAPGPSLAPPAEARLLFDPFAAEQGCLALFPDQLEGGVPLLREAPPAAGRKRVLHLGDSMVAGSGVDNRTETFVARLQSAAVQHLNAGVPGIGTDLELLLFRVWSERLRPDAAVLHVSPGTDVTENDRAYTCCDGASVLLPATLDRRCESPSWRFPWEVVLSRSPPPYPLRVLGHRSALARDLVHAWSRLARRLEPGLGLADEGSLPSDAAFARFDQLLAAFADEARARGIPLLVSVLPDRASLDTTDPRSRPAWVVRERTLARARALGLATVDGWAPFLAAKAGGGKDAVAADFGHTVSWDPHFSARGHARYAEVLTEPAAALLSRPAP